MKHFILIAFLTCSLCFNCKNNKIEHLGKTSFQKNLNIKFKDASSTPLTEQDLKHFKGLDFFPVDSSYIVIAKLNHTPKSNWIDIPTSTDRILKHRVFGEVEFDLKGVQYTLNVYQSKTLMYKPGYTNYLFLPFLDHTNGLSTYSGGRYIDLKIPSSNGQTLYIDFNKAYNPYCAYNKKYSCPIVPQTNYIPLEIKAGEKKYQKTKRHIEPK